MKCFVVRQSGKGKRACCYCQFFIFHFSFLISIFVIYYKQLFQLLPLTLFQLINLTNFMYYFFYIFFMIMPNLNQQGTRNKRRQLVSYQPNDFFKSFNQSQFQVIQSYQQAAEEYMVEALAILIDSIRKAQGIDIHNTNQKKQQLSSKKQTNSNIGFSFAKRTENMTFKKQIPSHNSYLQQNSTNPQKEIREFIQFQKTGKKQIDSTKKVEYCVEQKISKQNLIQTKKHQKLINSLRKLTVQDDFNQLQNEIENIPVNGQQEEEENHQINIDDELMKKKTISQLLQQSAAKSKRKTQKPIQQSSSSESQYEITDHQSNSDDDSHNYQERFQFEGCFSNQPIFGNMFMGNNYINQIKNRQENTDSVHHLPHPKLNFKPLLNSPKKQKTKKKRLYINKKKVPKWAQDLKKVEQQFKSQYQIKLRQQKESIFGQCIVEMIQTNAIFDRNDQYIRASTAKWQKRKDGYIV